MALFDKILSNFGYEKKADETIVANLDRKTNLKDYSLLFDYGIPFVADRNFMALFESVPEVAFPILYISERIAGGNYQLKKTKDDSTVWDNEEINKLLSNPNALFTFSELIKTYYCYYLVTGNAYLKAVVSDSFAEKELWQWCDDYWALPSDCVQINTPLYAPLFTSAHKKDIIQSFRLNINGTIQNIHPDTVLHKKDINLRIDKNYLQGKSRLISQIKPISNLIAVYEARNVIYVKRGALGMIVNKRRDESGDVPLIKSEKEDIRTEYYNTYGVESGKSPIAIVNNPVDFLRMNMSIQELEPFTETLTDAISIASIYGIPSILVPRIDQGTFSNQLTAEKSVYSSVIIPEATRFCKDLTAFLGLEKSGLYIDVDFSHVDVMNEGFKEKQNTKAITSEKCRKEFLSGIITLNDWRAQIGESRVDDPIYSKLLLQMNDKELVRIQIISSLLQTRQNGRPA